MTKLTRGQRGMAIFAGLDLLVFLGYFLYYILLRVRSLDWHAEFHFASGLVAVAITFFALAGSVTTYYATRHQSRQSYEIAMRLVVATLAVWAAVVILLGMEWVRLIIIMDIGYTTSLFSETYYVLTGYYLLHVLVGIVYQGAVAASIRKADMGADSIYVHTTNLIWVIVFFGVYLASTDLQGI